MIGAEIDLQTVARLPNSQMKWTRTTLKLKFRIHGDLAVFLII